MSRISYYNTYPNIDNGNLAVDQSTYKQMIIDFNNAMISAGLVRTSDTGQLDTKSVNTIPTLSVTTYSDYYGNGSATYAVGSATCGVYHKPIIYAFTDSAQSTIPVYIKIQFGIAQVQYYYNDPTYMNAYALTTYISVGSKTNGAGNITNASNSYYCPSYTSAGPSQTDTNTAYHYNKNSYINYNAARGFLHIELLPSWFQGTNNTLPTNNTTQQGYGIKLVISRNSDGSYIVLNPNYTSASITTLNNIKLTPIIR